MALILTPEERELARSLIESDEPSRMEAGAGRLAREREAVQGRIDLYEKLAENELVLLIEAIEEKLAELTAAGPEYAPWYIHYGENFPGNRSDDDLKDPDDWFIGHVYAAALETDPGKDGTDTRIYLSAGAVPETAVTPGGDYVYFSESENHRGLSYGVTAASSSGGCTALTVDLSWNILTAPAAGDRILLLNAPSPDTASGVYDPEPVFSPFTGFQPGSDPVAARIEKSRNSYGCFLELLRDGVFGIKKKAGRYKKAEDLFREHRERLEFRDEVLERLTDTS